MKKDLPNRVIIFISSNKCIPLYRNQNATLQHQCITWLGVMFFVESLRYKIHVAFRQIVLHFFLSPISPSVRFCVQLFFQAAVIIQLSEYMRVNNTSVRMYAGRYEMFQLCGAIYQWKYGVSCNSHQSLAIFICKIWVIICCSESFVQVNNATGPYNMRHHMGKSYGCVHVRL